MKIYNILANEWMAPPGRVYVVHLAPEITGDDLIIAHRAIDGRPAWSVTHVETSTSIARGATRKAAVEHAAWKLQHYGRDVYLKAVQSAAAKLAERQKS